MRGGCQENNWDLDRKLSRGDRGGVVRTHCRELAALFTDMW